MESLVIDNYGHELIAAMEEKYSNLVWYARKAPPEDAEYWSDTPAEIKTAALNEMAKVEEMSPDEVDALKCPNCGNWNHGFNSGMLAALRFVMHAAEDPEEAQEDFPMLDT